MYTDKNDVRIKLWRTEINGSIPYLVTTGSLVIKNDVTIPSATFTDNISDANLVTGEVLYSFAEQINFPSLDGRVTAAWRNAIWIIDSRKSNRLLFSKPLVGDLVPEFNENFVYDLNDTDDSDITGLASLDDRLVVFKQDGISIITGFPPNAHRS